MTLPTSGLGSLPSPEHHTAHERVHAMVNPLTGSLVEGDALVASATGVEPATTGRQPDYVAAAHVGFLELTTTGVITIDVQRQHRFVWVLVGVSSNITDIVVTNLDRRGQVGSIGVLIKNDWAGGAVPLAMPSLTGSGGLVVGTPPTEVPASGGGPVRCRAVGRGVLVELRCHLPQQRRPVVAARDSRVPLHQQPANFV